MGDGGHNWQLFCFHKHKTEAAEEADTRTHVRQLSCLPTVHMASSKSARAEEKLETETEVETKCPQCHHRPSTTKAPYKCLTYIMMVSMDHFVEGYGPLSALVAGAW